MATETVHQNGHVSGDGDSAPPGDATQEELIADTAEEDAVEDESAAEPSGVAEPVTEKSVEQKLYFFRLPYPDLSVDDGNIEKLRMEFERFKTEYELISAQMKGVKAQKDEARAETDAAREIFHSAKKEADKVRAVLNPLQGGSAETREAVAKFKNLHAPPFESEEKLDKRIAELEHSQAHESLTIREEKAVIKELQKLQKSRNVVREFEKLNADLVVAREAAEQTKSRRQDLQNELRTLKEEEGKAFEVLRQFEAAGKSFTDTLNELYQSLKEARAKKDERYDAWKEARAARRVKLDEFHANRDFSKKIRGMVKNGDIEEARELCNEQMETHLQKLKDEPAWAKQYFELWAEQRRPTITDAEIESDVQGAKAAAAAGKGAKGKAKQQPTKKSTAAPVSNEPSPADLVAAALRSAEEELNKARGARTALAQQASSRPEAQENGPATGSAPSTAPQPSAKPEKKAPKARVVEPLPEVHIDDTFVPPPQAEQQVKLSAAELKAKVREEQRQKMEEAMQRKALRKAKNERRKQRVQERKAQEALEAQETEQVTTDADTATDVETDVDESAAMTRDTELPEAEAKPVISAQQRKKMAKGAYAANRIAQKADGPRPMPKGVKKPSLVRQLKQFGQDYGPYVAIVVSGVTILTMTWGMVAQS